MKERSIQAYEVPERVAAYDADMDLMHPNRHKMVQAALEVLPLSPNAALRGLDLGVGTGFFTARFLERFPRAAVVAVDGAQAMTGLARDRLGHRADRVEFRIGDFRRLSELIGRDGPFDVAYSSFALHHLGPGEKRQVLSAVADSLRPSGWFVNADILIADSPELEQRFQQLRAQAIVERARLRGDIIDARFADVPAMLRWLAEMQAAEGDQPLTLQHDLRLMGEAGLVHATALWLEFREAVVAGIKASPS